MQDELSRMKVAFLNGAYKKENRVLAENANVTRTHHLHFNQHLKRFFTNLWINGSIKSVWGGVKCRKPREVGCKGIFEENTDTNDYQEEVGPIVVYRYSLSIAKLPGLGSDPTSIATRVRLILSSYRKLASIDP